MAWFGRKFRFWPKTVILGPEYMASWRPTFKKALFSGFFRFWLHPGHFPENRGQKWGILGPPENDRFWAPFGQVSDLKMATMIGLVKFAGQKWSIFWTFHFARFLQNRYFLFAAGF